MNRLLALPLIFACAAGSAFGGPFGLLSGRRGYSANSGAVNESGSFDTELYSAQGVANRIARTGSFRHWGNPTGGYEGIGMGADPETARRNCCYASRFAARDVGFARMASGMWVACQRY